MSETKYLTPRKWRQFEQEQKDKHDAQRAQLAYDDHFVRPVIAPLTDTPATVKPATPQPRPPLLMLATICLLLAVALVVWIVITQ